MINRVHTACPHALLLPLLVLDCLNPAVIRRYLGHQPASGMGRSTMANSPCQGTLCLGAGRDVFPEEEGFVLPSRHPDPLWKAGRAAS